MLTDDQRRRYARNLSLPEMGEEGQAKLFAARVLVIGAGGLGSPLISYLAAAGIGHIGIADDDRVELSNLQRQILHETGDIGRLKAESARDRVGELNPDTKVTIHIERVNAANAQALLRGYDIVADGSDNFATRFAVSDACVRAKRTLVSAALRAWDGQVAVFRPHTGGPCYRCFVGATPDDERGCRDAGVMGAFAGVIGSLQALEVIKEILGVGKLAGKLLVVNGLSLTTRITEIRRDPACICTNTLQS